MARLLLLRHGQSVWNAAGRWQGDADPPLSEAGERGALAAAAFLGGVKRIISSDLARARRTAELIAEALDLGPVEVWPALRERRVGEWSGLTHEEVDRSYPGYRQDGRRPPGWEFDNEVVERVTPALVEIADGSIAETLVVTHGGVIRALSEHLGAPTDESTAGNLDGRWFEVDGGQLQIGARVLFEDAPTPFGGAVAD